MIICNSCGNAVEPSTTEHQKACRPMDQARQLLHQGYKPAPYLREGEGSRGVMSRPNGEAVFEEDFGVELIGLQNKKNVL